MCYQTHEDSWWHRLWWSHVIVPSPGGGKLMFCLPRVALWKEFVTWRDTSGHGGWIRVSASSAFSEAMSQLPEFIESRRQAEDARAEGRTTPLDRDYRVPGDRA